MKNLLMKSLIIYFLCSAFTAFAGNDPPIATLGPVRSGGGGNGVVWMEVTLGPDDCSFNVDMYVPVANLHFFEDSEPYVEIIDGDTLILFTFPESRPNMYLRYTLGNFVSDMIPLTVFSAEDIEGMDPDLFYAHVESETQDLSGMCIENDGSFNLFFRMELMTESDTPGVFIPYPICEYTSEGDIFDYVLENLHEGNDPHSGRSSNDNTTGYSREDTNEPGCGNTRDYIFIVDCNNCHTAPEHHKESRSKDNDAPKKIESVEKKPFITTRPNPFNQYLEIEWDSSDDVQCIELFNTNGQLIKSWDQKNINSTNKISLETNNIPKGLYFVNIKMANSNLVRKIIKQ